MTSHLLRHRVGMSAACAAALVLPSCGGSASRRPPAPAPPPLVEIKMREYRYEVGSSAAHIPAGRVNFQLRNEGDQGHQPTLLILPDDVPPIAEQLKSPNRRNVATLANNAGIPAGVTGALAVDLKPGQRYAFVCFVKTADGKDHSRLGMAWEFRAGPAPPTDASVSPGPPSNAAATSAASTSSSTPSP